MRLFAAVIAASGCGSSQPAAEKPREAPPAPVVSVDAAAPDAGVPAEVMAAPAWIFRYSAPGRVETWTLRYAGDSALLVVEAATGTIRYAGTMSPTGQLTASTANAKMSLDCKPDKLAVGTKCNDTKAKKIDVLNCFHPDFKTPMTFGREPGIEFVTSDACTGYRLIAP